VVGRIIKAAAKPAYGQHEDRTPDARLRGYARGGDSGLQEELAAGMLTSENGSRSAGTNGWAARP
jgi:hypothetical protein